MKKLPLYRQWFIHFALYNLIFLSLQCVFILSKSNGFISAIPLPATVYLWLFLTLFIHLVLYFILSIIQTTLIWGLAQRSLTLVALERWHITIWTIFVCALLTSNAYFFPLSYFSRLFLPELPHAFLIILMLSAFFILGALLLNTLFFASKQYPKTISGFLFLFLSLFIYTNIKFPGPSQIIHSSTPNVILIGVDSLSPNNVNAHDTPTLARFINSSVFFKETISPLAHTYPSWSSILTGLYPEHHRARYNLIPSEVVKSSRSIAWKLQKLGYQTIFATDDRQFNNMGSEFGFQKIIGPRVGANDILLGKFNDFPLSNLLINLPFSRWLFPYNYINRASHFTYYPQSFDKMLRKSLAPNNSVTPTFIAVHFTLPHWPYAWATSSPAKVNDEYNVEQRGQLHLEAIKQTDKQVDKLLHTLQEYGYLENSLVILLSDHGEAFYVPGSRQTNPLAYQGRGARVFADYLQRKTSTALEMSVGHGSDLLSPDQYHCVLAFKIFEHNHLKITHKIISTRVALIDLAPTIYAFLGIPTQHVDGVSLLNAIQHNQPLPERAFVMESGMLPNQFLTREKMRLLGKKFFTIDSNNGQLQLRKNEIAALDTQKLYALIEGNWVFALYPDDNGYIPITLRLSDGKWTDELTTDFAKKSPAINMFNRLQHFYQKKLILAEKQ